jgi:hypothetical protein
MQSCANPSLVSNSLFSGNLPGKSAKFGTFGNTKRQIDTVFQWVIVKIEKSKTGNF